MQIFYQKPLWSSYIQPSVHALWIPTKIHVFIQILSAQMYYITHFFFLGPACSGCSWPANDLHKCVLCVWSKPKEPDTYQIYCSTMSQYGCKRSSVLGVSKPIRNAFSFRRRTVLHQWESQGLLHSLSSWGFCGGMVRIKLTSKRFWDSSSNASFWEILKLFLSLQQPATM